MSHDFRSLSYAPPRMVKAQAGLSAIGRSESAAAHAALSWVIRVPSDPGPNDATGPDFYPTALYGGFKLTNRLELALRFGTESDAREAGYMLRDYEDMFDSFDAVRLAS